MLVSTAFLHPLPPAKLRLHAPQPLRRARLARAPIAAVNWPDLSRRASHVISDIRLKSSVNFVSDLRTAALAEPENPFLWHALAKHLALVQNDHANAFAVLEDAIRYVPAGRRGGLYEAWGVLHLKTGDVQAALNVFREGIRGDPYAPLFAALGDLYRRLGRIQEARHTFETGTNLFPNHPLLWRTWAGLESREGPPEVARDKWRMAVVKDRTSSKAWRMLVRLEEKCRASNAHLVDLLYEAILACPKDAALRLQLAKLEEKRGGLAAARAVLKPAENTNDDNVIRALAKLEAEAGNHDKARTHYRKAADVEALQSFKSSNTDRASVAKQKPTHERTVKSLHAWALMEVRVGNVNAARDILGEAKAITELDSGIWRAIAELEARERNFEKARLAFQQAIAIDPDDARLFLAWGKMEALAGNLDRAEVLIDRVAKADANATSPALRTTRTKTPSGVTFDSSAQKRKPHGFRSTISNNTNVALTPHLLADALRERALLAARNGQLTDSVTLLTRASQIEPDCATGWRLLASQQLRVKGMASAREVYKMGLDRVAQSAKPKLLHWWGQDERSNGNLEAARERFRLATCASPDYMSAWMSWGLLEKSEGNVDEACDIFEQASNRAERDQVRSPFIFQAWGRVEELERGRADYASEIFRRGTNLVPTSGSLWSAWGLLEERRGNIEKARELFAKSTTTDPKHGSAWHSWALLEARRCNYEKASELFRKGNENDRSNASLLASWAMMENKELGNTSRGRDLFERAVSADPYFAPAWHAWGCLEMSAGSLDKAEKLFHKATKVRPEDPSPWHTLGILEAEHRHDNEAAIKNWKRAIEVEPGHALSYQAWALLEGSKKGDLAEARRLFQSALREPKLKAADMAMLLQSWASLEEQNGYFEDSRKLLRKGLEVDRRRAETWQKLALVEKASGNRDSAKKLLADGVESAWPLSGAAALYVTWATMEAEEGSMDEARDLFAAGVRVNPSNVKTWNAYASVENRYGDPRRAAEIKMTSGALFVRQDNANENFKL